jgi:hypothetical protein
MDLLAEILLPLSGLRHHEMLIVEHNLSLSFFQEKVDSIMPDFFSWLKVSTFGCVSSVNDIK